MARCVDSLGTTTMFVLRATALALLAASAALLVAAPLAAQSTMPTFGGLLQTWVAAGDAGYVNTFRIRRMEFNATGALGDDAHWVVMADFAKALSLTGTSTAPAVTQSSRILQDAHLDVDFSKSLHLMVGQQKLPLGIEGSQSSSTLLLVERALYASDRARGGTFGDIRDIGAKAMGKVGWLAWQAGAFNGSGESQNDVDHNEGKALIGSAAVTPSFISGLSLGGWGVYGGQGTATQPLRDREGAQVALRRGPALLQSELAQGMDGAVHRRGWYAHAGWYFGADDAHVRFDTWDPDTHTESGSANATERDYVAGWSWYAPKSKLRLQTDVMRKTFAAGLAPSRTLAVVNLQGSW